MAFSIMKDFCNWNFTSKIDCLGSKLLYNDKREYLVYNMYQCIVMSLSINELNKRFPKNASVSDISLINSMKICKRDFFLWNELQIKNFA